MHICWMFSLRILISGSYQRAAVACCVFAVVYRPCRTAATGFITEKKNGFIQSKWLIRILLVDCRKMMYWGVAANWSTTHHAEHKTTHTARWGMWYLRTFACMDLSRYMCCLWHGLWVRTWVNAFLSHGTITEDMRCKPLWSAQGFSGPSVKWMEASPSHQISLTRETSECLWQPALSYYCLPGKRIYHPDQCKSSNNGDPVHDRKHCRGP